MIRALAKPALVPLAISLVALELQAADKPTESTTELLNQMVQARVDDDLSRAKTVIDKLIALWPNSTGYRLEALRIRSLHADETREEEVREIVDKLCQGTDARVCQQAQEILSLIVSKRTQALRAIFAEERAKHYKKAVADYEALFFGAPSEDALRLRFYSTMLKIPERADEAKKALQLMAATTPTDPMIGMRAKEVIRRYEVDRHAAYGLANIAKKENREQAARSLGTALLLSPKDKRASAWRKALDEAVYRFVIEKARDAERAQRLREAESYYLRALPLKADKEPIVLQLADLARRQKNFAKADKLVRQALDDKPESAELRRSALDSIYAEELQTLADQYEKAQNWPLLIYVVQKLTDFTGETPALVGRLANAYLEVDRQDDALGLFTRQSPERLKEPLWAYGWAVVLERLGKIDEAIDALSAVSKKTAITRSFLERLLTQKAVKSAQAKAQRGELHQALRDLRAVSSTAPEVISLRADWASKLDEKKEALAEYERLFAIPAYASHARVSAADLAIELGDKDKAKEVLDTLTDDPKVQMTISQARRAISVYTKLGETDKVSDLFERHAKKIDMSLNKDYALFGKERADFLQSQGKSDLALTAYRQAFVNSGITTAYPVEDDDFTQAMLTPDTQDDWMREALRMHASLLYQNDNVIVTTGLTGFHDVGTPGYSDTNARIWSTHVMMPAKGGTLTLITDTVHYNMGGLVPGKWESMTGTCFAEGCDPAKGFTKDTGASIAAAWTNGTWSFDIGTTPIGFHYTDVTGALSYNFDLGPLSVTAEAYRRAKDGSLLAYGGQRDPKTGIWWGGVRRTGASVSVSKDSGNTFGFWGKASWEDIRGRNVARNSAWQVMATTYARLINKPNHELIPSVFMMLWGFEKDLSGYTFGHGGYYSPQQYVGFNVSINDVGRTENWAWRLTGTWGRSYAKTESIRRYPLADRIPFDQQQAMKDELFAKSRTSGDWSNGFQLQANLERRLGSHFSAGVAAGWSQAPDYDYRWALLYLRWYMKPWRGNLPMPVPLLKPYSTR
ncbi:MAG: cellulose synthase subunit BcsC-related outer membrane protein [Sutterellaceae bacterium]|nr:cellulose synthase subunit BcsC-related outer membrane protein [Sutterellaceae bacterium]